MSLSTKGACCSLIEGVFCTYTTVKLVKVHSPSIAIIHRILQVLIFLYIIGYIVVWKKGYQQFQEPHGTSIIKVKGVARVTGNDTYFYTSDETNYIWDTPEYERPPLENNALFIATRQTVTYDQTQGKCPTALEDKLFCVNNTNTTNCKAGEATPNTFGFFTGGCVESLENATVTVCEMDGWCPEELSQSVDYQLDGNDLRKFTIFLKTMVAFTEFKKTLRNVRDDTNFKCLFDGTSKTIDCPIIPVGYILDQITTNKTALMTQGGLIEIRQDWTCNFDTDMKKCIPTYQFSLLQSGDDAKSPGVNYRSVEKYRYNGTDYRTLSKIYGLRFVLSITGRGGQFNIVNLFVAIGSGIGFMVIASIVADVFLMYIHRSRTVYREGKFSFVETPGRDNEFLMKP